LSYFVYSVVLASAMLVSLPYWLYQILRHGKYRTGFAERMGRVPARLRLRSFSPTIWVHAVSVGEVLAVGGLVEAMRRALPRHRILISTTTDTGQQLAHKRFGEENVFYFPMDFAFAIRPYLESLQPELVVLAETEFWPNFLRLAHASGARVAVVNARISDRSLPNYRRFRWALRRMLAHVDLLLAQTAEDGQRLQAIGAKSTRVFVTGNLKFDVTPASVPPIVESLRRSLSSDGAGPVLVCGSSLAGEEALLLKTFETVLSAHPRVVMILAPRHPERFEEVAALLEQSGMPFFRRTQWNGEDLAGHILLVDSIGELASLYTLADVAFVGGSLVARGGHNIIEPALHGVPIIIGKHTENFRDIIALFRSRDAVRIVGPSDLTRSVMQLLGNDSERRALGQRALATVRSQTGATARTLAALQSLLAGHSQVFEVPAQATHTD
jgi:3-deoxy-D-manno-octulosonic-acid transferase